MSIYAQFKTCSKCGLEKSTTDFYKHQTTKDKLSSWCKNCFRELARNNGKNYYEKNKENILLKQKNYAQENRDKRRQYEREYRKNNKQKRSERHKLKVQNDKLYKLKCNIKCLVRQSIKKKKFHKNTKTQDILGCDYNTLKEHLENQFDSNMSWDNHGTYWDIDHIIPTSSAKTEEELIKLNHYTNLQPLESYYNRYVKGSNIQPPP